ncbi:MAG TPA: FmdE family protein [Anaerolineales bacterium]|nr:FmdE family protein [Anaerolineales bacterium]
MDEKVALDRLLQQTAALHRHLCPRQVLGVRMGMLAGRRLGVDLPQADKRVFVFMETDGCAADGVSVATGAWVGRRTMRIVDFGKVAATFVDRHRGAAVRIYPHPESRQRARAAAPEAADRWHAQLLGYQRLGEDQMLVAEPVALRIDLEALLSRPGVRALCSVCGEEIINEREVHCGEDILCRSCAGEAYYAAASLASSEFQAEAMAVQGHSSPVP